MNGEASYQPIEVDEQLGRYILCMQCLGLAFGSRTLWKNPLILQGPFGVPGTA